MRRFLIAAAVSIGLLNCATSQAAEILFMQQLSNPELDDFLIEYIERLGHEVTPYDVSIQDGDEQIELAQEHDLVYITESVASTSTHDGVETYIKEVATPQIWAEAYAWDEAAMTGDVQFVDFGNTQRANIDEDPEEEFNEGQDAMIIVDPTHPLAGGFPAGSVEVYEDLYSLNWGLVETLGPGAEVIGTVDEDGAYAALFTYDEGAELEDGTKAPAKRVGFWLGQAGLGAPYFDLLSEGGLKLIEAAISYGLGESKPAVPGDYNRDGNVDIADIDLQSAAMKEAEPDLATFDENADGKVNFADRKIWVREHKGTWVGDANFDNEFNSGDLVQVFAAGKYETGVMANWADGDWDGDMAFGSGDLVVAFADGGYELGPPPAPAVPEPSCTWLLLLITLPILRRLKSEA